MSISPLSRLLNLVRGRWLAWVCGPPHHTGSGSNKRLGGWRAGACAGGPLPPAGVLAPVRHGRGGASSAFPPCSLPPPSPRNSANSLQCKLTDPQFLIFQTNPERCQKVLLASLTPGRVSAQGSPAPAPSRISKCPGVGGSGGQLWPAWERLFPLPFEVLALDWQVPHLYNL